MDAQQIATEIVNKLVKSGYVAYFAGGWVRDYLLGHPSDDIDIATNAPPEKILDLFPHTILVGLAFGIVVVVFKGHQFEVATFRRDIDYVDGRKPTKIEMATPEEDASRRDFTINGMFYDPIEKQVYDFVHGAADLKLGIIRAIGNADERFVEDRLRMIRAVRFAARFGFTIDLETQEAIKANADTLFPAVAMERVWQEISKMAKYPHFDHAIIEMCRLGLLQVVFPALEDIHLHDIKAYVSGFSAFPPRVEPIIYLLQLFPNATIEQSKELCLYLRTSNDNTDLAEFFVSMRNSVAAEQSLEIVDLCAWVHHYAHPNAGKFLQVIAAHMPEAERERFLEKYRRRADALEAHIQRAIDKAPLVNASILLAQGVKPSRAMGLLIKEGERMAILNDLGSAEEILRQLMASPLWPKE